FVVDSLTMQLESLSQDSSKIKILLKLSDQFQYTDFKRSLEYVNSALEMSNRNNLSGLQGSSYKKKGDVLLRKGLYDRSLENYLKSKKIFEETGNSRFLVGLEHNIGSIFYRLEDYDKALEHYKEALTQQNTIQEQGDSSYHSQLHVFYNSIGNCYDTKEEFEIAESYFLKALESAQKFDDKYNLGVIYNNLGKVSLEMGRKEVALKYMKLALNHREQINDKNGMARSYLFLAEYYNQIKDYSQAVATTQKALELANEAGAMLSTMESYKQISDFYQKLGKTDEAFEAYRNYHHYSDSLVNETSVKEITSLQMQYEFDKMEKDRKVKQQRKEIIYYFLIAILVLGMIITGLLYGFIKNRARRITLEKENLEKDLEVKNKELTTNVMYLLKKNELIGNVSKRLLQFKTHLKKENMEPLQRIIFDLQAGADQEVWKEFELRFEQVHLDFFRNLKEIAPDMTPAELKICAFLRLNMNSKEISSIIHQSVKSVEVKRSRIRKKLKLTNTETNLVLYLNEL
ncbi:tetratricopeptide repeat protein, partial [Ancylomarina sp.]|uniref:tetratricopeptide repeat protein n=1 Tax=Ancylomarina sp. TaxID=1970196 RepID=UPI0035624F86